MSPPHFSHISHFNRSAAEYNLLAAQLQTNVLRHAAAPEDDPNQCELVLLPQLRLCNHACDANAVLEWAPRCHTLGGAEAVGVYVLRALRSIGEGEAS